jgi:AcrR family transcriptional regulator
MLAILASVSSQPGLRERKKQQTRQAIAEAARRLFAERGFDAVTVAEVAREADVSEGTVFNYFPTKEDLFYGPMEVFEEGVIEAVRERPAGDSVLAAFRRAVLGGANRLATEETAEVIATAARIVTASGALQARERDILAHYTDELARLIADETGAGADDVVPRAVANALMGLQRELRAYVWASVLAGRLGPELVAGLRRQGKRAFDRLEHGLGDYAVKPPSARAGSPSGRSGRSARPQR